MQRCIGYWCLCYLTIVLACTASAQWRVYVLHPAEATESYATALNASYTVGVIRVNGLHRAVVWLDNSGEYIELDRGEHPESGAYGIDGVSISGTIKVSGSDQAALWPTPLSKVVSLHPGGAGSSGLSAIAGGQQVGPYLGQATLWNGVASSWVSLRPTGSSASAVYSTDGKQQAGVVRFPGGNDQAFVWSGTAASGFTLHDNSLGASAAYGVHNGVQAGSARTDYFQSSITRAALWRGTPDSLKILHPYLLSSSVAWAVNAEVQVGEYVPQGGSMRAALWRGSAQSWEDLHAFVPGGYGASSARGVYEDGTTTYVAGVVRAAGQPQRAAVWVSEPATLLPATAFRTVTGTYHNGDAISHRRSDDDYLIVGPLIEDSNRIVRMEFERVAPVVYSGRIGFAVDANTHATISTRRVFLFDNSKGTWTLLKEENVSGTNDLLLYAESESASSFIEPSTRKVRARVEFVSGLAAPSWQAWIDRVYWAFPEAK